jgi:hypothetical protein
MLMLALRDRELGFASTVKLMVAGPVPLAGTPFTHVGTPLLVHPQPADVLTLNVLEAVPAGAV